MKIKRLLEGVKSGRVSIEKAMEELRLLPFVDLGFARVDTHRELRKGLAEVVFCSGKKRNEIVEIVHTLSKVSRLVLATRAEPSVYRAIKRRKKRARYYKEAGIVAVGKPYPYNKRPPILLITAGTSDIPIAEEAGVTCELLGNKVERIYDAGISGIHRLLKDIDRLKKASVIIVVAGMEGALASLIGGLIDKPIIAVPTSQGYGASFSGLSALLGMLNSCSPGIVVVNIDNGFGAGYFAYLINRNEETDRES